MEYTQGGILIIIKFQLKLELVAEAVFSNKIIFIGIMKVSAFRKVPMLFYFTEGLIMKMDIKKLSFSAICLALCILLPFLTGQIPQIGSMLSPMHIPVLLCGFICGWPYGLAVGFIAPLLRFALFSMPPIFPTGIAMSFELAAYGIAAGILYKRLPKTMPYTYVSLIGAMLIGRIVWGVVRFFMAIMFNINFSFALFISGAFLTAIPGIICHILIIPPIVLALKKAGLMLNGESDENTKGSYNSLS